MGLHKDLTGADLHVNKPHAETHAPNGTDPVELGAGIDVRAFGAIGDGVTDDAPAIRLAIDYVASMGGGEVLIPAGTFLLKTYIPTIELNNYWIFKLPSNITIKGLGVTSTLKVMDNINASVLYGSGVSVFLSNGKSNVHLEMFKVDCNGENNLQPNGILRTFYGAKFTDGANVSVEDTTWENDPGNNVLLFGGWTIQNNPGSGVVARRNVIHNFGGGVVGNVYRNDTTAIYTAWENSIIEENTITNDNEPTNGRGGIELHGSNNVARNNYIKNCYPAIYVCSDFGAWSANHAYSVDDIVTPTRGNLNGKQYRCTVAGTSGGAEPTWGAVVTDGAVTWIDNGLAQKSNQIVEGNTIDLCHVGVLIWHAGGDYNSTRICRNKIGLKQSTALGTTIAGITQVTGTDANGERNSVLYNCLIAENDIVEQDVISPSSSPRVIGIGLSCYENLLITDNHIHDLDSYAIYLAGSSRSANSGVIENNIISDFQVNDVVAAKQAIKFNFLGSTTTPPVTDFNANGIKIRNNIIRNKVLDATAYGFSFDWNTNSVIADLTVDNNDIINLGGVKSGAQMAKVNVTPATYFASASGYVVDKNGFITQWTRVSYTATANTSQTFSFITPFATVNSHTQLTLVGDSDAIVSLVSHTATTFTVRCSITSRDIKVFSVGN